MKLRHTLVLAGCFFATAVQAQVDDGAAPPPPPGVSTLSVKTSIVAVTALVRDKDGVLARNLTREDFTVKEDGKTQKVRYFDKDNDLPLRIGLMVDTSGSQSQYFAEQQAASARFLDAMLTRKEDQAFIVRFDVGVFLLQPMTSDLGRLRGALTMFDKKFPHGKSGGGTLLYDALVATAQQVAGKEQGRRAVVVLTDGEDNGSITRLEQAVGAVQKADVSVYVAIYTDHDTSPALYMHPTLQTQARKKLNGRSIMEHLAQESGGRLFVVTKDMTIDKIFLEVEHDMRMQYRLGYVPAQSAPGTFHALEVKVKNPKFTVQARTGYYTPKQ
jgi:Ca-activated chloride channel family protein